MPKSNIIKFFWSFVDRAMFIGIGALGAVATTYITGVMKLNPPKLVARPTYTGIDPSPVPDTVGGLRLDYEKDLPRPYGVLRVDIANEGRGAAEKVRFQVKLPEGLLTSYYTEPDLKIYTPTVMTFEKNEFYTELAHFPSGARDFVALAVEGEENLIDRARIKIANDDYEGMVEKIGGLKETR